MAATTDAVAVAVPAPTAPDDDSANNRCAICLDDFAPADLATLACCTQRLCMDDVQRVGVCPFCRQEPVFWFPGAS
jgi:hypothetical protein